mmetsp:Transcript_47719/g.132867  ORF Transcript_47719/g.132867 Transcript_47719/m.132867 type:complete len:90 (-) Transcript_47719:359-628(-)
MIVSARIWTPGDTIKTIKIQLALEAGELGLAEVMGHYMLSKLLGLVDNKATTVMLPGNHMRQAIPFHFIQDTVHLLWKGNGYASSAAFT